MPRSCPAAIASLMLFFLALTAALEVKHAYEGDSLPPRQGEVWPPLPPRGEVGSSATSLGGGVSITTSVDGAPPPSGERGDPLGRASCRDGSAASRGEDGGVTCNGEADGAAQLTPFVASAPDLARSNAPSSGRIEV